MNVWRQGDVYLTRVEDVPREARARRGRVLFHGELTGHSHRLEEGPRVALAELPSRDPSRPGEVVFLHVSETARLVHDEHGPIVLEPGCYRVWRQREYSPASIRVVRD